MKSSWISGHRIHKCMKLDTLKKYCEDILVADKEKKDYKKYSLYHTG
jgi:hypothetical protein